MQIPAPLNNAKIKLCIFSLSNDIKGRTQYDLQLLYEAFINVGLGTP